jgi:glycosyltransferase involved in cell wall biosynthesis
MKQKLVYILPELSQTSHMKYNAEFIQSLTKEDDFYIKLIIERGEIPTGSRDRLGVISLQYTGNRSVVIRMIKLIYFLITARLEGYRSVYVHYSFVGALFASFVPGMKVYYWNCGMPFCYKRSIFTDWYQKLTYKRVNYFVTGTQGLLERYSKFYDFPQAKGIVIPNWIDVTKWQKALGEKNKNNIKNKYNIDQEKIIIFSNQRLSERKGAHYLASIADTLPENTLLIISNDGPYKQKLINELEQKKCKDKVILVGKLDLDGILDMFTVADIFILPSDEEGMSHSLLEAMAAGIPSVAYDVGANKEVLGTELENCIAPEKNLGSFLNIVSDLLKDKEKQGKIKSLLIQKVKDYDKNISVQKFKEALDISTY